MRSLFVVPFGVYTPAVLVFTVAFISPLLPITTLNRRRASRVATQDARRPSDEDELSAILHRATTVSGVRGRNDAEKGLTDGGRRNACPGNDGRPAQRMTMGITNNRAGRCAVPRRRLFVVLELA